jgi:hypothetical protein
MLIDNAPALIHAAADVMNITPDDITGKRKTFAEASGASNRDDLMGGIPFPPILLRDRRQNPSHFRRLRTGKDSLLSLQYCENTRERVRKVMQKYSENILATTNPES